MPLLTSSQTLTSHSDLKMVVHGIICHYKLFFCFLFFFTCRCFCLLFELVYELKQLLTASYNLGRPMTTGTHHEYDSVSQSDNEGPV